MTQNRNINANVGYTVNQASVQQAVAANQSVAASYATVNAAVAALSPQMLALNPQLVQLAANSQAAGTAVAASVVTPIQAASTATQTLIRDIGDLGRDIENIPEPDLSAFGIAGGSGGGGGVGIGGLRSGLRAGGFLLGADAGGGALRSAGQIVTLTSVMGPLGLVAGVAAVALRSLTENEQKATDAAKAYSSALQQVATQTSPDIQKQIATLTQQKAAYENAQTALQGIYDQAKKLADGASKFPWQEGYVNEQQYLDGLKDLDDQTSVATGGMITSAADLSTALENGQAVIDKTTGQIGFLFLALDSVQIKVNDFALAFGNGLEKAIDDIVKALEEAARLRALTIGSQTDAYLQALADEGDARDAIIKLTQEQADAEAEYVQKYNALEEDYQIKRGEIEQDGAGKREQLAEDNNDRLAKIAQDNADRVTKIERDFARSYEQAVGDRDALGAYKARQKRDDDLADQAIANQKALDDQAAAYAKQLDQQQDQEAKQLRSLEDSYDKQLLSLEDALQKQRAAISQRMQQAQLALQQALLNEATIVKNHQNLREIQEFDHQNKLIDLAYNAGQATEAIGQHAANYLWSLFNSLPDPSQGGVGGGTIFYPPGSDLGTGTPFNPGGTAFPTPIYGPRGAGGFGAMQSGASGGMNLNFAPTMQGATVEQMMTIATRQFLSMLRDAGYVK